MKNSLKQVIGFLKVIAAYFKNLKLQAKLIILFLILTIIPFSVLGFLSYSKSSRVITSEVLGNSNQIVKQISDKIDYNMKELDKNTLLFVWNDRIQSILSSHFSQETLQKRKSNQMELESAMQTFLNTRLEIESVYIYRYDGDEYYIDNSIYNQEVRKRIIMKRSELTSEAEKFNGKNDWITLNLDKELLTGTRIIYDTINLNELGLLVINIQEKYVRDLYSGVKLSPNSFFIIRSKSGDIVSTNSTLDSGKLTNIIDAMHSSTANSFTAMTSSTSAGDYFIVNKPADFTGWDVYGVIPRSELLGGITQIGSNIFFTVVVCSVVSVLLLVLLSSYILGPIKRIMKLMKRVEQEDFSVKAEPESMDELGELTLVFNKMIEKIRYLIEQVYKQQIVKKEAEFKFLQAQINPHFLYNTLDSINWIAKINGVEEISKMVVALGQLMRISISKGKGILTLEQELEYINSYLIIQSMRYRDKFKVDLSVDPDAKKCIIPKMILQPIVENALVHGIEKKIGKGLLSIKAGIESGSLLINVSDDGQGMDREMCEEILKFDDLEPDDEMHMGIGVSNVNRRIKMIYGQDYGIKIVSEKGRGTDVQVMLPVILDSGEGLK